MLRLLSLGVCVAICSVGFGQDRGQGYGGYGGGYGQAANPQVQKRPQEAMVPRIYRVSDLVLPTRHYKFEGVRLPGLEKPVGGGTSAGGNMGGGGMGGGMMGGMYDFPDRLHLGQSDDFGGFDVDEGEATTQPRNGALRMTMQELVSLLEANVSRDDWEAVGGSGTISVAAGMLVISQSERVHKQIGALLTELRKNGATVNSLTVRAWWLSSSEIESVMKNHRLVDRAKLAEAVKSNGAVGQISCFDGQTVHLVTGNIRSVLTSVIPVVGQLETSTETLVADNEPAEYRLPKHVLAQVNVEAEEPSHSNPGHVGYQPVTKTNVFGGQLQLTASLEADGESAILDVQSVVMSPKSDAAKTVDFHNVTKLALLNVVIQQFSTTVRLPVNQPVLVGGSTLQPMQDDEKQEQLYLIMEVLPDSPIPVLGTVVN